MYALNNITILVVRRLEINAQLPAIECKVQINGSLWMDHLAAAHVT